MWHSIKQCYQFITNNNDLKTKIALNLISVSHCKNFNNIIAFCHKQRARYKRARCQNNNLFPSLDYYIVLIFAVRRERARKYVDIWKRPANTVSACYYCEQPHATMHYKFLILTNIMLLRSFVWTKHFQRHGGEACYVNTCLCLNFVYARLHELLCA